jgi:hypothetical protein
MPLPRWLHSLLPRKPLQTGAPPPSSGAGGGQVQPASTPDHSHRIHIAANDPAFPAKREAAVALICQAITDIAAPMGYTRKGTTWSRETSHGKSAIHLQRSRYGFTASITLRFLTPDGSSPQTRDWAQDNDIPLQRFYLPTEAISPDDALTYLDIHENPPSLNTPMHILATRALPWLDAHHATIPPNIETYLPH